MKKIYTLLQNIVTRRISLPLILSHLDAYSIRPTLLTNTVLLYGNPGSGKSTMLWAIADEFLKRKGIISSVNMSVYDCKMAPDSLKEPSSFKTKSGLDLPLFKNVTEPILDYTQKLAEGMVAFSSSLINRMLYDNLTIENALLNVWKKSGESATLLDLVCELKSSTHSDSFKLFINELESKSSELVYTLNKDGNLIDLDTQGLSPVISYLWIQSEINRMRSQPAKEKLIILDELWLALPVQGNNISARLSSIKQLLDSAKNYNIYVIASEQSIKGILPLVQYLPTIVLFKGRYPGLSLAQEHLDILDPATFDNQSPVTELLVSNQLTCFTKLRVRIK